MRSVWLLAFLISIVVSATCSSCGVNVGGANMWNYSSYDEDSQTASFGGFQFFIAREIVDSGEFGPTPIGTGLNDIQEPNPSKMCCINEGVVYEALKGRVPMRSAKRASRGKPMAKDPRKYPKGHRILIYDASPFQTSEEYSQSVLDQPVNQLGVIVDNCFKFLDARKGYETMAPFKVQDMIGRIAEGRLSGDRGIVKMRVYIYRGKYYLFAVYGDRDKVNSADATRFLDSFVFVKKEKKAS